MKTTFKLINESFLADIIGGGSRSRGHRAPSLFLNQGGNTQIINQGATYNISAHGQVYINHTSYAQNIGNIANFGTMIL